MRSRPVWRQALPLLLAALAVGCTLPGDPEAPHIILFIGDGMQLEHEIAASRYRYGSDHSLAWNGFPYQAYVSTWDVDTYNAYAADRSLPSFDEAAFDPVVGYDPVAGGPAPFPVSALGSDAYFLRKAADSASSATAYATGRKTDTGNISWIRSDPAGGGLQTIAERVRALRGASIGVVTTVPFNHATPAAFVAHNVSRSNYAAIADEIIGVTRPEVVIGAGHPSWNTSYFTSTALADLRADAGYTLVERQAGVDGRSALISAADGLPVGKKLFGLFGTSTGDMDHPVPRDSPGTPGVDRAVEDPTLADMVEAALTVLARDADGFFLMAEQGDIDHANHANDFARMIGTVWGLEDGVNAAVAFVDRPGDGLDWNNTLLIVTADHANSLLRLTGAPVLGLGDLPAQVWTGTAWSYPGGELTYGSTGHTNELVTLYARGAGAQRVVQYAGMRYPGTSIIDNIEVYSVLRAAAGLR
jgi:alkaline phosphatase